MIRKICKKENYVSSLCRKMYNYCIIFIIRLEVNFSRMKNEWKLSDMLDTVQLIFAGVL